MIDFEPVTGNIGAEVTGVDLTKPLSDDEVAEIRQGLLDHLVLFFRDQHITDDQHLAFALRFGELNEAPFRTAKQETAAVSVLDQTEPKKDGSDEWHNDNTFMPNPPMGSLLRAIQLPSSGGDTCFANMYLAYEALSPGMRRLADELVAVHDPTHSAKKAISNGHPMDLEDVQRRFPPIEHPIVVTHPETGRKALYLNRHSVTHLKDLPPRENETLLPFLFDHVRAPNFQCRLRWKVGTLAFWDNRPLQHYGVADYDERRVMHRVTVNGPPLF